MKQINYIISKQKRKPIRKKSLTKTLWKKAFRACERAMIAAANRRDQKCQLCGSKEVLQMDHAIVSRKHLSTFFEIRQMVLLCQKCHCSKSFDNHGLSYQVIEIVRNREGAPFINKLVEQSRQIKKWSLDELEEMTKQFNEMYQTRNEHRGEK